jgi:hypothetical protein
MILMGSGLDFGNFGELTVFILDLEAKMEVSSLLLDFCRCKKARLEQKLAVIGLFSFLLVDCAVFFAKHLADMRWALSTSPIEILPGSWMVCKHSEFLNLANSRRSRNSF